MSMCLCNVFVSVNEFVPYRSACVGDWVELGTVRLVSGGCAVSCLHRYQWWTDGINGKRKLTKNN